MHGQRGRGERHAGIFLDMAHLILGIAIVILDVLSFINPEGNHMLFPLVFLLAAQPGLQWQSQVSGAPCPGIPRNGVHSVLSVPAYIMILLTLQA